MDCRQQQLQYFGRGVGATRVCRTIARLAYWCSKYSRKIQPVPGLHNKTLSTQLMTRTPASEERGYSDDKMAATFRPSVQPLAASVEVSLPTDKLRRRVARGGEAGQASHCPVVLVACGSYNPPTLAHLRMFDLAEHALTQVRLTQAGYTCASAPAPTLVL